METPIEGGKVTIGLIGGQTSKFDIRIVTPNVIFISAWNNRDGISILKYSLEEGKWKVDGSNIDYDIAFEPPDQIRLDSLNNSSWEVIRDVIVDGMFQPIRREVDRGDFETADLELDKVKSTLFQKLALWYYDDLDDLYHTRPDITLDELVQKLDWLHKHGAVYGGPLLKYYLDPGTPEHAPGLPMVPMVPPPSVPIVPSAFSQQPLNYHPRLYDVIDWILDHNIPVDFDPRDWEGNNLRPLLRYSVVNVVFARDNSDLFRRLYQIPGLFDFISVQSPDEIKDGIRFIQSQIHLHNANRIQEALTPVTKAVRKR